MPPATWRPMTNSLYHLFGNNLAIVFRVASFRSSSFRHGGQGGEGETPPPQYFGRSVNPISFRGRIMPNPLLFAPPGFPDLPRVLRFVLPVSSPEQLSSCCLNSYAKYSNTVHTYSCTNVCVDYRVPPGRIEVKREK